MSRSESPAIATPADPADAAGFAAAREMFRRRDPDGFFAVRFLPPSRRDAACAVGAFCGMTRDALAGPEGAGQPSAAAAVAGAAGAAGAGDAGCCSDDSPGRRAAMMRDRLDELYTGRLELPAVHFRTQSQHVLHVAADAIQRWQIPREHFAEFIEGCRVDTVVRRYATWRSLEEHCRRTGGAVGRMMGCILGLTHSQAADAAAELGAAGRFTTILCTIPADLQRGILYLPLEDFARFRFTQRELSTGIVNERFASLMRFEIARARDLYRRGAEAVPWLAGDGSRLAASIAAVLHSGLLQAIERQGYDVFSRRPRLGTAEKLRRLPAAWRLATRRPDQPLPRVF